jgi:deoxyhypusine synthase
MSLRDRLRTHSVHARDSRVQTDRLGQGPIVDIGFPTFIETLPKFLAADDLREVVAKVKVVRESPPEHQRGVMCMIGGHVIKTGCGPYIQQLIREGYITHLAMNGAAAIHDVELALFGHTSEDVAESLADGSFGAARETAEYINKNVGRQNRGYGASLAHALYYDKGANSVLGAAWERDITITVHSILGAEIIHQHASADGAVLGAACMKDFDKLCDSMLSLHEGGVVLHFGSAVVLPEVFLKALAVSRNVYEGKPNGFCTVDFDMIKQYRPLTNIVHRPTLVGGKGISITGHHEIMIPLLTWMLLT